MKRILMFMAMCLVSLGLLAQQASRDFDSTPDYLTGDGASNPNFTVPFTAAAWIYKDTTLTSHIALATHGWAVDNTYHGMQLSVTNNDAIACNYGDGGVAQSSSRRSFFSTETVGTGAWHHIACVITGSTTGTLYLDGSAQTQTTSGTGGTMAMDDTDVMYVGGYDGTYTEDSDGRIVYVALWDRALSVAEIEKLQHCAPTSIPNGLEHYIPLRSGTETDMIGGESFTATGTAASTDGPPIAITCTPGPN